MEVRVNEKINWRQGLLRLWIVLAALWLAVIGTVAVLDTSIPSLTKDCSLLRSFNSDQTHEPLDDGVVRQCDERWKNERLYLIELAFGPPLAAVIFGLALGWIGRGFRPIPLKIKK
jgi:hypothetical protein